MTLEIYFSRGDKDGPLANTAGVHQQESLSSKIKFVAWYVPLSMLKSKVTAV